MWIENVTRSKAMKEQLDMFISFDTTFEDIEALLSEMETFIRSADNSRDFHPDLVLECTGIGNMDKLQLKIEIRHKVCSDSYGACATSEQTLASYKCIMRGRSLCRTRSLSMYKYKPKLTRY